jgi:hypothetical protein
LEEHAASILSADPEEAAAHSNKIIPIWRSNQNSSVPYNVTMCDSLLSKLLKIINTEFNMFQLYLELFPSTSKKHH